MISKVNFLTSFHNKTNIFSNTHGFENDYLASKQSHI